MKQLQILINLFLIISSFSILIACNGKTKSDQQDNTMQVAEKETNKPQQTEYIEKPVVQESSILQQELEIFDIGMYEVKPQKSTGFISLSEIYPEGEHPDSVLFPDLSDKKFEDVRYLPLTSNRRELFLSRTKISETDNLFIYDFATNVLAKFKIANLNVIAIPSVYRTKEDWPFPQEDFMVGFEIKPNDLKKFGTYLGNCLVYIGKENPFIQGQVKPIKWDKIAEKEFPSTPTDATTYSKINADLKSGYDENLAITNKNVQANAYKYEADGYQYFVKSFFIKNEEYNEVIARRLLIFKSDSRELVCEKTYIESDGTTPTPLNYIEGNQNKGVYQWTGKLFKDKPPVIFGFEYASFGCPEITFLSKSEGDLYINCDNRH